VAIPPAAQGGSPAAPEAARPAQAQPQYAAQQPYPAQPYPAQPYPAQQPPYGTQPQPYPAQQAYPAQQPYPAQPPYPAQQPYPAQPPYPAQQSYAGPPPAAPWGAGAPDTAQATRSGRSPIDALLTGDWGGAAKAALIAVAAMLAVSLVGVLLMTSGGIGFRETLALILGGACLAVGGDFYAEADAESFGASSSFGLLPLTVTLVGLGVLGWLFARQLRAQQPTSTTEVLLHGVRTALVFTVCFLPLALLTRYKAEGPDAVYAVGRLGVGVFSTLFGALLFAVAVLGLTVLLHRSTALPGRVGVFRDKALAPLVGAVVVFSVGLLAVLAVLIYGLIEDGEKMMQLGVAVLGAGNGALATVLWSAGVPLAFDGSANATGPLAQYAPVGSDSMSLFTFTDASGWYWLAPVVLLATMVLVATALAVRQNTIEDARREGFRFAGALALVAFVAALLLRIGFGAEGDASEFAANADGSAMFNPLLAAFALAIWGVLTGLLGPVVAAKVPSGFVTGVRRKFGAAVEPTPPAH
jgi:hypothetical protein